MEGLMALVVDTAQLGARDRIDAVNAAMSTSEVPHVIEHGMEADLIHHRLELWELGPGTHLLQMSGTRIRMVRGPRQLAVAAPERLALASDDGPSMRSHLGAQHKVTAGELFLVDQTSVYGHQSSEGVARAFIVDYEMLGLPIDLARRAVPSLKRSPLYSLVRTHFDQLCVGHDDISGSDGAAMLGGATTELLRALIVTAVDGDTSQHRQSLEATLLLRIKHYVERHLTEPTLDVDSIAAAHNISVRRVYQVWAGSDLTLGQWIMRGRLEGARRELARPAVQLAIAQVARRWGFLDAAHFSRRFRAAYEMSPREWRQVCAPAQSRTALEP
jgi:AraC-like DNA-binding protein